MNIIKIKDLKKNDVYLNLNNITQVVNSLDPIARSVVIYFGSPHPLHLDGEKAAKFMQVYAEWSSIHLVEEI